MNNYVGFLLLLILLVLTACTRGTGIYGVVNDKKDKKPVERAIVKLMKCEAEDCENLVASQETNSDGRFEFSEANSGRYMITVSWERPPDCPDNMLLALRDFEFSEGDNTKLDFALSCP